MRYITDLIKELEDCKFIKTHKSDGKKTVYKMLVTIGNMKSGEQFFTGEDMITSEETFTTPVKKPSPLPVKKPSPPLYINIKDNNINIKDNTVRLSNREHAKELVSLYVDSWISKRRTWPAGFADQRAKQAAIRNCDKLLCDAPEMFELLRERIIPFSVEKMVTWERPYKCSNFFSPKDGYWKTFRDEMEKNNIEDSGRPELREDEL